MVGSIQANFLQLPGQVIIALVAGQVAVQILEQVRQFRIETAFGVVGRVFGALPGGPRRFDLQFPARPLVQEALDAAGFLQFLMQFVVGFLGLFQVLPHVLLRHGLLAGAFCLPQKHLPFLPGLVIEIP